jgi:hypothetical protein
MSSKKPFTFRAAGSKGNPSKTVAKVPSRPRSVAPSSRSSVHAKQQPPAQVQQVQVQADEQSEGPVDLSAHPVTASLVVANDGRQLQCTRALLGHADQLRQVLIDLKLIVATMTVESTAASSATAASRFLVHMSEQTRGECSAQM